MLRLVWSLAEAALATDNPEAMSNSFFGALERQGATYLQTRIYRRPHEPLTSQSHWAAGGFAARFSKPQWPHSPAFNYVCFDCNPLLQPISRGATRYRFSDFARHRDRAYRDYWDAMGEADIADALCASAYGADRRIVSFDIGFGQRGIAPDTASAVQTSASILAERLMTVAAFPPDTNATVALTRRERDALSFVAHGKTDWEIATIMGVSESTARFHVDNARRKYGAVNRAHAVAKFLSENGPL